MKALRALRALLRVERRQLWRHPGRSLLVLMLVAVPVAAIVGGSGLAQMTEATPEQRAMKSMGRADLRIEGLEQWEDFVRARENLPEGAILQRGFTGLEQVSVPGRRLRARLFALEPAALEQAVSAKPGLATGMLQILDGRAPANAGEVALSPALLEGLERSLGETVTLAYGAERTITGIVVDPEDLELPVVLRVPAKGEYPGLHFLLAELPQGELTRVAAALREADLTVLTRSEAAVPDEAMTAFVFALGTIGLFEAALVISAAFGVSLRRRQVEIGLLGSTGATGSGITQSLLLSVAMLALLGGVVGTVLGIAALAAISPWLEGWTNRLIGPLVIVPEHVVGAILLGTIASMLAAVLPARGAARLPIRQALAGRRPTSQRSRAWLFAGLSMIVAGLFLLMLSSQRHNAVRAIGVIFGPIFSIIGFGACSPWLLDWSARRAARLPLAWRLAVRDAGRFRDRNGAVVTAVLAGMAMSVTMAALVTSLESAIEAFPALFRDDHLLMEGPGAEEAARKISEQLPTLAATPLTAAYIHGEPVRGRFDGKELRRRQGWIAVGDEELLRTLGAEAGLDALREGKLLVLDAADDVAEIDLTSWVNGSPVPAPPMQRISTGQLLREPVFVLATGALADLGFETGPPPRGSLVPWLVRLEQPVTPELFETARTLAAGSVRTTVDASLLHQNRFRGIYYVILLICAATGIVVVVTATALSAAESKADERVLHTVGASPSLLRGHQAARAGYLALLGCVLSIPAGLLAAAALFGAVNFPLTFVMPWRDVLIIVAGLPAMVYTGTWCFARLKGQLPRAVLLIITFSSLPFAPIEASTQASSPADLEVHWQPYTGTALDGSPLEGELGKIRMPENRQRPAAKTLEIAFVRFRTSHPNPGPPIFFLAGGPGGSGIEGGAVVATHPQIRLLEHSDVIGIDQRGTGLSLPDLTESETEVHLPTDRSINRAELVAAIETATRDTVAYWRGQGVDLSAYNSVESADDVDAVRQALGIDKIILYGASYGSHLGLAYLRRHDEHVARAVLSKVEGPNHTFKLPSTIQSHLRQLGDLVQGDPALGEGFPNLLGTVRDLIRGLSTSPVTTPGTDTDEDPSPVTLGPLDLQIGLSRALASSQTIAEVPAVLYRFANGDWRELAETARDNRRVSVPAMALMMDCASGATPGRWQRLEQETFATENLLSDAILAPFYPEACAAAGRPDLGDAFRGPLESDVPVMFTSGTLDVRTPPGNVDEILPGFPNAVHVVVENAGHESRELMSPEYRDLLQAFLRGEEIQSCKITLPEPIFEPIS